MNVKAMPNPEKALGIEIKIFSFREIMRFLEMHLGNCNSAIPPQSLLFPATDITLTFAKIPFAGTSPFKLLNDKLRYSKERP